MSAAKRAACDGWECFQPLGRSSRRSAPCRSQRSCWGSLRCWFGSSSACHTEPFVSHLPQSHNSTHSPGGAQRVGFEVNSCTLCTFCQSPATPRSPQVSQTILGHRLLDAMPYLQDRSRYYTAKPMLTLTRPPSS